MKRLQLISIFLSPAARIGCVTSCNVLTFHVDAGDAIIDRISEVHYTLDFIGAMSPWTFTDSVSADRASQLQSWTGFDHVVKELLATSIQNFWWEPFRGVHLAGCNRASFTMKVAPRTYDAFFNSPVGYRGQYAISPSTGEAANRRLLSALEPLLLRFVVGRTHIAPALIETSLRAVDAKVWIDETEVDGQLSDSNPAIACAPWEFNSLDGQGLRAPIGTILEIKGGWLDPGGNERRNPSKASRSLQIYNTGFS